MKAKHSVASQSNTELGIPPSATPWAQVGLAMSMLLPSLATSIANVGMPTLVQGFSASLQEVQWVVLSYLLVITSTVVSVGRLGDSMDKRPLLVSGILIFTTASALCGAATELWQLVGARAFQGLGAAIMMSLTVALVGDTVPKERVGTAMGMLGTMSAIGTSLGPSLGGVLIELFGWQAMFLVNVPLGIVTAVLALRFLPARQSEINTKWPKFDLSGTLVLALTLVAYALSMTIGRGNFGKLNAVMLAAAAMGVALFIRIEARSASPLLHLSMFRSSGLGARFVMNVLVSTVMMATLVVGPFYLTRALELNAMIVGLVVSAGPVIAALAGLPAGRLVDRWGPSRATVTGLSSMIVGLLTLSLIKTSTGVPGYVIPIALITGSYALFQAANNTALMTSFPSEQRGVVSGILNLSRNLGLITGTIVMGAIFSITSAASSNPDSVTIGMRSTFAFATVLVIGALAIAKKWSAPRNPDTFEPNASLASKIAKGS